MHALRRLGMAVLLAVVSTTGLAAQTLGSIDFPVSGTPEAQAHFLRGVLLLHNFEYERGELFARSSWSF